MRIAIVGAGALGLIYGVRLAQPCSYRERHDVTFVVRPARLAETHPFRIESAVPFGRALSVEAPRRATRIPDDVDVALVTLRFDNVTAPEADLVRAVAAPSRTLVVVLSPVFAEQREHLERLVGGPVVPAMPGVSGYADERGVIRHWVPPVAPTMIDDGSVGGSTDASLAMRHALVEALREAGLPALLVPEVAALNAATTTSFFPAIAAVAIAGDVASLAHDAELVDLVVAATKECAVLAGELGPVAAWAGLGTSLLGPKALRAGATLGRLLAPEAVHFVDVHFGPKLLAQHLSMGRHIAGLAAERGVAVPALDAICERLAQRCGN